MKVNPFLKTAVVSIVLPFLFAAGSSAEPYVAKEFPPDELLLKAHKALGRASVPVIKILGKTGKDNTFTVYYQGDFSGVPMVDKWDLVRLDTDVWIFHGQHVIQK